MCDTEQVPHRTIEKSVSEQFDLRPAAFRRYLGLHRLIYGKTAAYGHFGRDEPDFTWERTDKAGGTTRGRQVARHYLAGQREVILEV